MGVPEAWKKIVCDRIHESSWKVTDFKDCFSLLWDANGVLYDVANDVFGLGSKLDGTSFEFRTDVEEIRMRYARVPDAVEAEFIEKVLEVLSRNVFEIVKPSVIFILVIDGIAPPAKANQQRARRTLSAINRFNKVSLANNGIDREECMFDTTQFTVGTPIMKKICIEINNWIVRNRKRLPRYVKFSGCDEIGEGEHKMLHILEKLEEFMIQDDITIQNQSVFSNDNTNILPKRSIKELFETEKHIVLGLDSDLMFLTLIRPQLHFYWLRDAKFPYKNQNNVYNIPYITDIDAVKDFILTRLGYSEGENQKEYLTDFVLLTFFIGDDFVPPMFTLSHDVGIVLDTLMEEYKNFFKSRNKRLTNEGIIIKDSFKEFLENFISKEQELYNEKREVNRIEYVYKYNSENNIDLTVIDEERNEMRKRLKRGEKLNYEFSYITYENDYETLLKFWPKAIICPSLLITNNISPKTSKYREILTHDSETVIHEVCDSYIKGLQWNLLYYLGKDVNSWIYEWPLSPLIYHLNNLLQTEYQIPNMFRGSFDSDLNLSQNTLTILNFKLLGNVLKKMLVNPTKNTKITDTTLVTTVGKSAANVKNYGAYLPVDVNVFYEGKFFKSEEAKFFNGYLDKKSTHGSIPFLPVFPYGKSLKLATINNLDKNGIPNDKFRMLEKFIYLNNSFISAIKFPIQLGDTDKLKELQQKTRKINTVVKKTSDKTLEEIENEQMMKHDKPKDNGKKEKGKEKGKGKGGGKGEGKKWSPKDAKPKLKVRKIKFKN
jgi:hypothetical protein